MPLRPWTRHREGVLPPNLEDWVAPDHPVRFVAVCVEDLTEAEWTALGIARGGHPGGAPADDPVVLLAVWLDGFMTGVRSCRALATAGAEQVPFRWLTGGQRPDHTTLWRFDQGHRAAMPILFTRTVATAATSGLVVWAIQAVDGTKIGGNAATDRTRDAAALTKLVARVEAVIAELEAQNRPGGPPTPPRGPAELARAEARRDRVRAARDRVTAPDGPTRVNRTDPEAGLVTGRPGVMAGSTAQAVAARVRLATPARPRARAARLLTATTVVPDADDHGQLVPMLERAEATTGHAVGTAVVDGGDHDGATVAAGAARGQRVVMPEAQQQALADPFHTEHVGDDAANDTDTGPAGTPLTFRGVKERTDRPVMRVSRGEVAAGRACPHVGTCTTDARQGRALAVGPHEEAMRAHRAWMATAEAATRYRDRTTLIEPVFGVRKEALGARRFLLRGLANVRAEWVLLATAFNLRTLVRRWPAGRLPAPAQAAA